VEQGFDTLAPMLSQLLADPAISGESAMYLVVMDPLADRSVAFGDAILRERAFGDVARWHADYAWYAREKARVAWREQTSLRTLLMRHPERLRPDDIRVEGAVRSGRWTVGASGAQPHYDHAIASMAAQLFDAAIEHSSRVQASQ
jgi:hypothetical protein